MCAALDDKLLDTRSSSEVFPAYVWIIWKVQLVPSSCMVAARASSESEKGVEAANGRCVWEVCKRY
jgi:hypothetical protein